MRQNDFSEITLNGLHRRNIYLLKEMDCQVLEYLPNCFHVERKSIFIDSELCSPAG